MVDPTPQPAAAPAARLADHAGAKDALARVDDETLCARLADSATSDSKHRTIQLPDADAPVFAKLVPLSDIEVVQAQRLATNNVFELPSYYQYRLGSLGFGAWRERAAQQMATEWALAGALAAVPFLHGWRVLPITSAIRDDRAFGWTWGGDPAIARRIEANLSSTTSLALFMEPYTQTFAAWLDERLAAPAEPAVRPQELEDSLLAILRGVNTRGMLHMDAHLENFLTDGDAIVLGDYGLASARAFDLSVEERHFLERHEPYDRCTAIASLVLALARHYDEGGGQGTTRDTVVRILDARDVVPEPVHEYLVRRAPVAFAMSDFYRLVFTDMGLAEFPANALKRALDGS